MTENMKIKIPPYPNFKITEEAHSRDVIGNSVKKTEASGLSNHLIVVTEFKTGEKRVIQSRPVRYDNKLFVTAFPNPIHLLLSVAVEHYNNSENVKETNFIKCAKKFGDDLYFLDIEENGTHECYNHYVKYRASSIIMLVSALEAYLNHIIPNDFIYIATRKDKKIEFNKEDIESSKVSFREKLTLVIPQWLKRQEFWKDNSAERDIILDLYENRKNIIHLKTNSQEDFDRYFPVIDKMLDLNIFNCIDATIKFMNLALPNFIELDKE